MGTNAKFRDLAIRTLIGEAARGDTDSMISVAHVIKNRADSGAYGDASQGGGGRVILAPKQFSMWNADIPSSGKTISPNDPLYQRAGAIVDGVFNGQIPDNTGGADHYYAPGGMPGGRAPSWAIGRTPTATIGGQHFYKMGLGVSDATNQGHTSAPAIGEPAPAATPAAASGQFGPNDVYKNIPVKDDQGRDQIPMFMRWNPDPVGNDAKNLAAVDPALQRVVARARAENPGLSFVIGNGRRSAQDQDQARAWDWSKVGSQDGGDANVHMNGRALDLWGLDKEGHVQFDPAQQRQISAAMQKAAQEEGVQMNWGGNFKSFQDAPHFELAGKGSAEASGAPEGPTITAPAAAAATTLAESRTATPDVNPSVPAANAQPVSATAPAGASPTPGPAASPSVGFVGPGSDKYSVIQSMTTGTSHNPQLTTAANWGNLFGGAASSVPAPPAAAPAAAPSSQSASAPAAASAAAPAAVPINRNTPLPWQGPAMGPAMPTPWQKATTDQNNPMPWPAAGPGHVPVWGPWHAGGTPTGPVIAAPPSAEPLVLPSVSSSWGASNSVDPDTLPNTGGIPGGGVTGRAPMSQGAPSMGFPAQTNPFGQPQGQQVSQLPGSMFASAQNLIKYLFPSATG